MKKFDLKNVVEKVKTTDYKKLAKDFWYGKPHGERRLGDLYCDKTGLYKHREWRGVKDTFYYFNKVWLYNYGMLVYDVMRYGGIWTFAKGCWRYRWMGQTYLPVLHWFDRGMEGLRGEALRACPLHYRAMTNATIYQFMQMFRNDLNTNKGNKKVQARHDKTIAHDETVWGGIFYPFSKEVENVPLQMIPYFVTCPATPAPCVRPRPDCSFWTTCPITLRWSSPATRPATPPSPPPSFRTGSSTSLCSFCLCPCSLTIRWSRSTA